MYKAQHTLKQVSETSFRNMVSETFVSETAQHTHKVVYTIRILKFIGAKYEREL